jgi:hypothetical protein
LGPFWSRVDGDGLCAAASSAAASDGAADSLVKVVPLDDDLVTVSDAAAIE